MLLFTLSFPLLFSAYNLNESCIPLCKYIQCIAAVLTLSGLGMPRVLASAHAGCSTSLCGGAAAALGLIFDYF